MTGVKRKLSGRNVIVIALFPFKSYSKNSIMTIDGIKLFMMFIYNFNFSSTIERRNSLDWVDIPGKFPKRFMHVLGTSKTIAVFNVMTLNNHSQKLQKKSEERKGEKGLS